MEQYMWLLVEGEQVWESLPPSTPSGASSETMIMGSLNLQHLIILTCCLNTRRAGMARSMTLSEYPGITETSWPALWVAAQAAPWHLDLGDRRN